MISWPNSIVFLHWVLWYPKCHTRPQNHQNSLEKIPAFKVLIVKYRRTQGEKKSRCLKNNWLEFRILRQENAGSWSEGLATTWWRWCESGGQAAGGEEGGRRVPGQVGSRSQMGWKNKVPDECNPGTQPACSQPGPLPWLFPLGTACPQKAECFILPFQSLLRSNVTQHPLVYSLHLLILLYFLFRVVIIIHLLLTAHEHTRGMTFVCSWTQSSQHGD